MPILQSKCAFGSYRSYNHDTALLEEALQLIDEALRLKPGPSAYYPLSVILMLQGKLTEAEAAAQEYVQNAPEDFNSHSRSDFFMVIPISSPKAIAPFEASLKQKPEYLYALTNLVLACNGAKEEEKRKHWSEIAIPLYEKRLKLFPDEENNRVYHAILLHYADRDDDARARCPKAG